MTATTPSTAAEATPMAHTPDQRTDPPAEATAAEPAAAEAQSRLRAILGDNPLATAATALASGVIALLLFILNGIDNRIDRLEDTVADGFAEQDAKMDRRFAEQDAKIDEINLKLTALIAGLNMTGQVDAALEGRLRDPEPAAAGPDDASADTAESTTR